MDKTGQRCNAGLALSRVPAQQANRPIVCQGFVAQSSSKKGLHSQNSDQPDSQVAVSGNSPSSTLVLQELKHYSEASSDLQLALKLEPNNKTFARELDQLSLDVAELRKQRAVLRQLAGNNSGRSSLPVTEAAHQLSAEQPDRHTASAEPLVEFLELIKELRDAGEPCIVPTTHCLGSV